jgi:Fe-S-cluster containining protein
VTNGPLDAGEFRQWVTAARQAIAEGGEADVPCQGCTACCRSSQFVEVGPDETAALAHINPALLFPAPGRPGFKLLGYDERGHCPMLINDQCSIYEHRPRACRTYDCRVFPAAGLEPDEPGKEALTQRIRRWRFTYADAAARREHDDVRKRAPATAGMNGTEAALRAVMSGQRTADPGG